METLHPSMVDPLDLWKVGDAWYCPLCPLVGEVSRGFTHEYGFREHVKDHRLAEWLSSAGEARRIITRSVSPDLRHLLVKGDRHINQGVYALIRGGFQTIEAVDAAPDAQLLRVRGLGPACLRHVRLRIHDYFSERFSGNASFATTWSEKGLEGTVWSSKDGQEWTPDNLAIGMKAWVDGLEEVTADA